MEQYAVATPRKGQGPHSISLTLSRPLAGNELLITCPGRASIVNLPALDDQGNLRPPFLAHKKNSPLVACIFFEAETRALSVIVQE